MEKDIKAVALLLATQAMINLGVIEDPVTKQARPDLNGAELFIDLLRILEEKTDGNLTQEEADYLGGLIDNLDKVYQEKINSGH